MSDANPPIADRRRAELSPAQQAAKALAAYLDQAGIVRTEDRISALRRHYAITWLDMLRIANLSSANVDIVDILDGRELLIAQMRIAEESNETAHII